MVVLTQYPHFLYVQHCDAPTIAENGDRLPGAVSWRLHSICREETAGKGVESNSGEKRTYQFSSLIQLPTSCKRIKEGITVLVSETLLDVETLDDAAIKAFKDDGTIRIIGKNAKFDSGRLHCRMWV